MVIDWKEAARHYRRQALDASRLYGEAKNDEWDLYQRLLQTQARLAAREGRTMGEHLRNYPTGIQTTHWEDGVHGNPGDPGRRGCWAFHQACAITKVERLEAALAAREAELEGKLEGKCTDPIGRWLESLPLEDQQALAKASTCSVDWEREMRRIKGKKD